MTRGLLVAFLPLALLAAPLVPDAQTPVRRTG
jgi:hypothetical protein